MPANEKKKNLNTKKSPEKKGKTDARTAYFFLRLGDLHKPFKVAAAAAGVSMQSVLYTAAKQFIESRK